MPKLGIISDTHGRLPDAVFDAFADVDTIIHAGDICAESVLWELESIAKTVAVLGNCDRCDYGSSVRTECRPVIGGVRIWVAHFPEDAVAAARSGAYELAIHGHTHIPRDEVIGSCRVLNPGSACRPRGGSKASVMTVEVADGKVGPSRLIEL